jgi:LysM repeat protein
MKRAFAITGAILLLALTLQPVVAAPAQNGWTVLGYHIVQPGETLFCVARAYGVDPWAIASYNGVVNPNVIYPGLTLAIPNAYATLPSGPTCPRQFPPSPAPCTCTIQYTIVTGDNLYRISLLYGVSMWSIAECNSIYNLNYIRAGDTLCIPDP